MEIAATEAGIKGNPVILKGELLDGMGADIEHDLSIIDKLNRDDHSFLEGVDQQVEHRLGDLVRLAAHRRQARQGRRQLVVGLALGVAGRPPLPRFRPRRPSGGGRRRRRAGGARLSGSALGSLAWALRFR